MQYWVDLQASRQVKDPVERAQANMALRKLRENMANAERLMTPAPISPDRLPARRTRFKLNDLRSTPWGQQWLQQNPEMSSMESRDDPQEASDLWALYLASPQFMYR